MPKDLSNFTAERHVRNRASRCRFPIDFDCMTKIVSESLRHSVGFVWIQEFDVKPMSGADGALGRPAESLVENRERPR